MCHNQYRPPFNDTQDRFLDRSLRFGINRTGRFIQKKHGSILANLLDGEAARITSHLEIGAAGLLVGMPKAVHK